MNSLKDISAVYVIKTNISYNRRTLTKDCMQYISYMKTQMENVKTGDIDGMDFNLVAYLTLKADCMRDRDRNMWIGYFSECGFLYGVEQCIKKSKDWNCYIRLSAKGGQLNMIKYFIEKVPQKYKINWNTAMEYAALGNHIEIVKFCIEKGADHYDGGLLSAIKGSHKQLIKFFIDKGAKPLKSCLHFAAAINDVELIDLFLKNFNGDQMGALNICTRGAARGGHLELLKHLKEKGADCNFDDLLWYGAIGNHIHIINYSIENGATKIEKGLKWAAKHGSAEAIKYFINKGAKNLQDALDYAFSGEQTKIIQFFYKKQHKKLDKQAKSRIKNFSFQKYKTLEIHWE